jgi:hypothetical protein
MPNERWLRHEAPLMKSVADFRVVTCPASFSAPSGGTRREPSVREATFLPRTSTSRRQASRHPEGASSDRPRSASPMGSVVASEQALAGWPRDASRARPITQSVAPFGVNAFSRLAHPHRGDPREGSVHLRGPKKPTVVRRTNAGAPTPIVGDGCPGADIAVCCV